MINLSHMKKLGRLVRRDDWPTLGQATPKLIAKAIDEKDYDTARALAEYIVPEGKGLHDLFCDWIWDMLSKTGELHGEEAVYRLCRATQETWMMKRTWKALMKMSVEDRVYLNAEVMRSHLCGPKQDGEIEIIEEEDLSYPSSRAIMPDFRQTEIPQLPGGATRFRWIDPQREMCRHGSEYVPSMKSRARIG